MTKKQWDLYLKDNNSWETILSIDDLNMEIQQLKHVDGGWCRFAVKNPHTESFQVVLLNDHDYWQKSDPIYQGRKHNVMVDRLWRKENKGY